MTNSRCDLFKFVILVSFLSSKIYIIQGLHIEPTRIKRGIFGVVTSTVFETIEKKYYIPYSCIYTQPNLPNCRNVRFLFPQNGFNLFSTGNEITPTSATQNISKGTDSIGDTGRANSDQNNTMAISGWGQYLGFYQQTVTTTQIRIVPTTVLDSRITVTYAVRGCKPQNLPALEKCPEENPLDLVEIIPTTTVRAKIEATRIPDQSDVHLQGALESAELTNEQELVQSNRATKSL